MSHRNRKNMYDIQYNVDIKRYITFGISAEVGALAVYRNVDDLKSLLALPELKGKRFLNLGSGSNMLFTERFDGVVLHSQISNIEIVGQDDFNVFVRVGAGVIWDDFVDWAVDQSYYGVENLSAIPGTVGASAVQNIGAYGAEAKDVISKVEVLDVATREISVLDSEHCEFGYRDSVFKHGGYENRYIVTHVVYRLTKIRKFNLKYGALSALLSDPELSLRKVRDYITEVRNKKLPAPGVTGSAGSFFKNPLVSGNVFSKLSAVYPEMPHYDSGCPGFVKLSAGWLIENAGLKGCCVGGAEVWPKQCLVIANAGGATACDVLALMRHIRQCVMEKFGVELSPEALLIAGDGSLIKQ